MDKVELIRRVAIKTRETNNVVERLHETLKERLKPMRGLKREKTAKTFLDGWFVFYNFLRPHQSLNGNTPSKIYGVYIKFENWKCMIQKATKFQAVNSG